MWKRALLNRSSISLLTVHKPVVSLSELFARQTISNPHSLDEADTGLSTSTISKLALTAGEFGQFRLLVRKTQKQVNDSMLVEAAKRDCAILKARMRQRLETDSREDMDVEDARLKIVAGDPYTICYFQLNLSKQGLDEKVQIPWVQLCLCPTIFKPTKSAQVVRFHLGDLTIGVPKPTGAKVAKSIDAYTPDLDILFVFKYSGWAGGGQDNTTPEVMRSIEAAVEYFEKHEHCTKKVYVYVDGKFWTENRIQMLRRAASAKHLDKRVFVSQCAMLKGVPVAPLPPAANPPPAEQQQMLVKYADEPVRQQVQQYV